MASRLNTVLPVGIAFRYIRAGSRVLQRTITTRTRRRVVLRFTPTPVQQSTVVEEIRGQPRDIQQANNEEAEIDNSSGPSSVSNGGATATVYSPLPPSERESCYGLDLALSVALYADKEHHHNAQDEANSVNPGSSLADERFSSRRNETNRSISNIYNSLKSAKKHIDNFVKWYRRQQEQRNMI